MKTRSFFQKVRDGEEIWVNQWLPEDDESVKGVVVFHHGLCEHSMRYESLATTLSENGYVVQGYDMRGHGRTAVNDLEKGSGMFGKLAENNGFDIVVDDLNEMIDNVKKDYPDKEITLLAHSFGSFVGQAFIEEYGTKINKCLLMGTSGPNPIAGIGCFITKFIMFFKGKNKSSKFLYNLAFGSYNKKIENPKSKNAWLTKDEFGVQLYEMDEWCNFDLTTSFYKDMTQGLVRVHSKKNMKRIPKDLPLLFVYGSDDPVGNYGKSIKKLISIYKENGVKNITEIIYEGDRHEPLHETNHEQVESDILEWIAKK
ncbi:MAG: alpha/beta fold hydrolase [Treponema sp.]|nr:alpha/beta fold hydrolase [Treponema sp.]